MAALTPEQRQEIEKAGEEPVRLSDPETHRKYVIVKEEAYERMRALLEEEEIDPSYFEYEDFEPL
jgi:hypothetical protein